MASGEDADSRDIDVLYQAAVERDNGWRQRREEIEARLLGEVDGSENEIRKRIERAIEESRRHDELLTSTISAFGPNSTIFDKTGWRILCAEPLHEVDPSLSNPDALIGHDDRDTVLMVECKTGLASPQNAIEQIRSASESVLNHRDYLCQYTGVSFDSVEPILCVPGEKTRRAQEAIEREEQENDTDTSILLWKLFLFQEETLQLHQTFETRSESKSTHDSQLSQYLGGDGIEVVNCPLLSGSFYPESNIYNILEEVFFDILISREGSDNSTRKFTRDEICGVIDDQRKIPHYDTETIAEQLTSEILSDFQDLDLIESVDPVDEGYGSHVDLYQYQNRIGGTQPSTIISNLKDAYKERWIALKAENDAKEQVVNEAMENQTSLEEFG